MRRAALLAAALLVACEHWPPTPKLEHANAPGYRFAEVTRPGQSDDLLVVLAISGGGTRAAALGFGVMEELRRTEITVGGVKRRLMDEVDVISAVSGGTLPATYYGLRGDKAFDDFEQKVLTRNFERELLMRILTPTNWVRLPSGTFGRSDLFAELYDQTVFGGATFADMKTSGGPFVIVNGTDITTGARFSYTQDYFDAICGDLSKVTLGRAVATSTALAPLLTPITLENRAGKCGRTPPSWQAAAAAASEKNGTPGRADLYARALASYERPNRNYIHLFDGGMSENLGLTEVLRAFDLFDVADDESVLRALRRAKTVIIVVANAQRFPEQPYETSPEPPSNKVLQGRMWSIPVDRISLDAVEQAREKLEQWERGGSERHGYLAYVTFDRLKSAEEQAYFKGVKTSLALPKDQVDKLREVGARLLRESPGFRKLIADANLAAQQ